MKTAKIILWLAALLVFEVKASLRADVWDRWTTNQITTNSFGINHVVFGNGVYVAVGEKGDSGAIYSSTNGRNWILRYSDANSWGLSLTYSGGRFVAVGGWEYAISADGTNWSVQFVPQQSSSNPYGDMTFSGSRYVLVGNANGVGTIFSSTDGINWTSRSAATMGGPIASVTYGTRFVAVGLNDGYIYTASSTAVTWIRSTIPGGSQVSYGNGLYFIPLNNKTNLVSNDGLSWSQVSTGLTNQLGRIAFGGGVFLARFGDSLATSRDGTNWYQHPQLLPPGGSEPFSTSVQTNAVIATDGAYLVTVGKQSLYPPSFNFNGFVYCSDLLAGIRLTNIPPHSVVISGLLGRNYQIQSTDALGAGSNWRTNVTIQLTNTPYVWTDSTATNSGRLYRNVLLP